VQAPGRIGSSFPLVIGQRTVRVDLILKPSEKGGPRRSCLFRTIVASRRRKPAKTTPELTLLGWNQRRPPR